MNPEVEVVGGFEDELVIVGVVFEEVEPLASLVNVGVTCAIVELVGSERQADVGCFSELMLRVLAAANVAVEQRAAVTKVDGDGLANIVAERLEDVLAEVAQILDY